MLHCSVPVPLCDLQPQRPDKDRGLRYTHRVCGARCNVFSLHLQRCIVVHCALFFLARQFGHSRRSEGLENSSCFSAPIIQCVDAAEHVAKALVHCALPAERTERTERVCCCGAYINGVALRVLAV